MIRELPFDSIESAQELVLLFSQVVTATKSEIAADVEREKTSTAPRRLRALQIIAEKLDQLEQHLTQSRRAFNDLRSLRRLVFGERNKSATSIAAESTGTGTPEHPSSSPAPPASPSAVRASSVPRKAKIRKRAFSSVRTAVAHNAMPGATVPWYVRPEFKKVSATKPPLRS